MAPVPGSGSRAYDIILFGATGYTGKLCAEHITTHLPTDIKWALAGRSKAKLEAVAKSLVELSPIRNPPDIEIAGLNEGDLDGLAKKTKLIISTVGPYCLYGEVVVAACANNGTHYLDVTGETVWVYEMIKKYHEKAKASGAIIIPEIGIESAPADLASFALVSSIRENLSAGTAQIIFSVQKMGGLPSGGTLATIFAIAEKYKVMQLKAANKSWALSPIGPPKKPSRAPAGFLEIPNIPPLGHLSHSVQGTADRAIVQRSWGLIGDGKFYGNNFSYYQYQKVKNKFWGYAIKVLVAVGFAAIMITPIRWLVKKFVFKPGEGAGKEADSKDIVEYAAIATPDSETNKRALARMKYRGGNYYFTGLLLAQGAMTLLRDDTLAKKLGGGVLTPATLGQPLIDRLKANGTEFSVEIIDQVE